LLGAVAALAFTTVAKMRRDNRPHDLGVVAEGHGLKHGSVDPFGSSTLLFDRFNAGVARGFGPFLWDPADAARIRVFDFWWETEDSEGNRTRHTSTSIAGALPCWCPYLVVRPEGLSTRLIATAAAKDIEVESEEFNRMFYVRCDDRAFATAMLGPQLIDVLLTTDGLMDFEVHGDSFCLTTRQAKPAQFVPLLQLAHAVHEAVPANLSDLYRQRFV
jgi:hypothetical protein